MPSKGKKRQRALTDAFIQHGVTLEPGGPGQLRGDCPFCDEGEERFYVNRKHALWDCKVCMKSGNLQDFFRVKGEFNAKAFRGTAVMKLAKDRGVNGKTLKAWRVGWDGRSYTIPVDLLGKTYDLRRYKLGGKVMASTGSKLSLAGIEDKNSNLVWLVEGESDAFALWECLRANNHEGTVVVASGAGTFPKHALPYFQAKRVYVCFDHDDAGARGAVRVQNMLRGVAKELQFVHWPDNFPAGYDVRDLYAKRKKTTIAVLKRLSKDEAPGTLHGAGATSEGGGTEAPALLDGKGMKPEDLVKRYRKWLYLPDPEPLHVMYGAVLANRLDGDPIWLFMVAPPGGSKSELLMSLTDAPLITSTTTMTPHTLISGASNMGAADPSLLPKLDGKVLIIKDFTTILDMPVMQRDEIFGTLRDAYDGKTEKHWGTGLHRSYESKFGILAGVTPVIELYGAASSTLGERFLKYRLPLEGRIRGNDAVIDAALANIGKETKMREELREISAEALNYQPDLDNMPRIGKTMLVRLRVLAQWVARLRGIVRRERYTGKVEFKPTSEVATRLAKQLARIGLGLAMFRHVKDFDEEVYKTVVGVARSTTPDRPEEVVKQLYLRAKEEYVEPEQIAEWCRLPTPTIRDVLEDLSLLNIIQKDPDKGYGGWKLSYTVLRMMRPLKLYWKEEVWGEARASVTRRRRRHGKA